jgi:Tfp pilus assembly PilM family ATPase
LNSFTTMPSRAKQEERRRSALDWLDAMPHPSVVVEIASTHVAAARWGRSLAHLTAFAAERLPDGAVTPSVTQANIAERGAVRTAIHSVMLRVPRQGADVALLLPDPSIRVFILPFDTFPRSASDALPLLRWRLKKSLPFDAEEAVISWMRQPSRDGKIDIVAAVARQKVVREYESLLEEEGLSAGVVQSSTLATLPILNERGATLLTRFSGRNLTTVIVRREAMCVYRSTELGMGPEGLKPQTIFDEVFPAVAFYQDAWNDKIEQLRVAGFGAGEEELREALAREIGCPAEPLAMGAGFTEEARSLVAQGLEPLVGWQMNRGA